MQSFEYFEAKSLEEVVQTLASGEEVRVLAGGCGILLLMKQNLRCLCCSSSQQRGLATPYRQLQTN